MNITEDTNDLYGVNRSHLHCNKTDMKLQVFFYTQGKVTFVVLQSTIALFSIPYSKYRLQNARLFFMRNI